MASNRPDNSRKSRPRILVNLAFDLVLISTLISYGNLIDQPNDRHHQDARYFPAKEGSDRLRNVTGRSRASAHPSGKGHNKFEVIPTRARPPIRTLTPKAPCSQALTKSALSALARKVRK